MEETVAFAAESSPADDDSLQNLQQTIADSSTAVLEEPQVVEIATVEKPSEDPIEDVQMTPLSDDAVEMLEIDSASLTPVQQAVMRTLQASRSVPTSNPSPKQVAIAPKPFSLIKKITVGKNAVPIEISGRQMVVMKPGSTIQTASGQVVCATAGQVLQLRPTSSVPLAKTAIGQEGNSTSGNIQKTPRYISLQQAKQMGLVSAGKLNQLVAVSPIKQTPNISPTIRPAVRQIIPNIKSPTKILPAIQQGSSTPGKVILTPQNIVIKPTNSRPSPVIKLEGITGTNNTILTNISPGQKINSQQIHQINVPGKGIQFVRLVSPSTSVQKQKLGPTSPVRIAPIPTSASRVLQTSAKLVHTKSPQMFTKGLMVDMHGNVVQLNSSNNQSISSTAITSTSGSATTSNAATTSTAIKKIIPKPLPAKCVPVTMNITSSFQKISSVSTIPSFTITSIPATQTNTSTENKLVFLKLNNEMQVQKTEVVDEEIMNSEDLEDQFIEKSPQTIKLSTSPDLCAPLNNADTKHVVLVPPHFIQQMQGSNANSKPMTTGSNVDVKPGDGRNIDCSLEFGMRPRKPCNCTKSQCLKLYCDCFANGEFCNQCNCNNCYNNLENEEYRQKAIRTCLDRNPNAFRPKIGKAKNFGLEVIRRHNKGCNCKRSGCLKNYCECYEGKIACSANCKCVGCRNIADCFDKKTLRKARAEVIVKRLGVKNENMNNFNDVSDPDNSFSKSAFSTSPLKRPSTYMTNDLIDAICACLLAQAADAEALEGPDSPAASRHVLEEFSRCLQDLVNTTQTFSPSSIPDDARGTL